MFFKVYKHILGEMKQKTMYFPSENFELQLYLKYQSKIVNDEFCLQIALL